MPDRNPDANSDHNRAQRRNLHNPEHTGQGWMTSNLALMLAEFTQALRFDKLPDKVIHQGTLIVRDTLGTLLAGATISEIQKLVRLSASLSGPGNASLMGYPH